MPRVFLLMIFSGGIKQLVKGYSRRFRLLIFHSLSKSALPRVNEPLRTFCSNSILLSIFCIYDCLSTLSCKIFQFHSDDLTTYS